MFKWISQIFKPATKLIDELHTSKEEKMQLRNELANIQAQANAKFIELAKAELETRSTMAKAEAASDSWLQQSWRPVASLILLGLVVVMTLDLVPFRSELYHLTMAFLGISSWGRGTEKTARVGKLGKTQ